MSWKMRLMMRESALTAGAFTLAVYSYYLIAIWGSQDHFLEGPLKDYMLSPAVHVELLLVGVLFGGLIGVINRLTETPRLRSRPVGQLVLLRTAMHLLSFAVVGLFVVLVFAVFLFTGEEMTALFHAMTPRSTFAFATWAVLAVGGINFGLEVERLVGPGNFWGLLRGRYRRSQEEHRVFLFMDLKGSTPIAERLGHRAYSELLQECYGDLTDVVLEYQASIYQYVGDEVVLSWLSGDDERAAKASVRAFFAYRGLLEGKQESYEARFGVAPEFRGGVDQGPVTVIEVGDVKRDIVFHGDVLNTAARLLELAKTREEGVAVSQAVAEAVGDGGEGDLHMIRHGEVRLRGKRDPVEVYGFRTGGTPLQR